MIFLNLLYPTLPVDEVVGGKLSIHIHSSNPISQPNQDLLADADADTLHLICYAPAF